MPPILVTFVQGREELDGSGSSDLTIDFNTNEYEVQMLAGDDSIQITISSMTTTYETPEEMLGLLFDVCFICGGDGTICNVAGDVVKCPNCKD